MTIINYLRDLLKKLFNSRKKKVEDIDEEIDSIEIIPADETEEVENPPKYVFRNEIFEKLEYLEQYIKIFSLNYPEEYNNFLQLINKERGEYDTELQEYQQGKEGQLVFAIDPESECNRYVKVSKLEDEIRNFVELTVNYETSKEKFLKLCKKLNVFYNTVINADREYELYEPLSNALDSMEKNLFQTKNLYFFKNDSRLREQILNYVLYCDYIIFKSSLRCLKNEVRNHYDYKSSVSKVYTFFESDTYDKLIFKFFIEDLEQFQIFIKQYLTCDGSYEILLNKSQEFQIRLQNDLRDVDNYEFFEQLIKFENTVINVAKAHNIKFELRVPEDFCDCVQENISCDVNNIAITILSMIDSYKANILHKVISSFQKNISWKDFFFFSKIFELSSDIVDTANNTIFSSVENNFSKMEMEYAKYSTSYIELKKQKLLEHSKGKLKKYFLLLIAEPNEVDNILTTLEELSLDFRIIDEKIYLNYSYIKGFTGLEANLNTIKIF